MASLDTELLWHQHQHIGWASHYNIGRKWRVWGGGSCGPPRFSTYDHFDWKHGIILNVYQRHRFSNQDHLEEGDLPVFASETEQESPRVALLRFSDWNRPVGGGGATHLSPIIGFKHVSCVDRWLVETKWHFEGGVTPSLTLDRFTLFPQRNGPAPLQMTLQFRRARVGHAEKCSEKC